MFWEESFTLGEFTAVNMKNCGRQNFREHREIKDSDKYITLDISLKLFSLDKIRITYLEPGDNLERLGKGLIASLDIKAKTRPKKYKKSRYDVGNVSMKDTSNIIREFDKLPYKSYEKRIPKHEPIDSYFYLEIHIVKCMMRYDALNSHIYPVRTELNGVKHIPVFHVFPTGDKK